MNLKDFFKRKKKEETNASVVEEKKNPYYVGFCNENHVFIAEFNYYIDTSSKEHPKDENGNYINGKWDNVYISKIEASKNSALIPINRPYDTVTFSVNPKSISSYTNGAIYECTYSNHGKAVTNSFREYRSAKKGDRFWSIGSFKMQAGLNLFKMIEDPKYASFVMKSFDSHHLNELGYGKIEEDFPNESVTWEKDENDNLIDAEAAEKYKSAYEKACTDIYSVGGVVEKNGKLSIISPEELEKLTNKGIKPTTPGSVGVSNTLRR